MASLLGCLYCFDFLFSISNEIFHFHSQLSPLFQYFAFFQFNNNRNSIIQAAACGQGSNIPDGNSIPLRRVRECRIEFLSGIIEFAGVFFQLLLYMLKFLHKNKFSSGKKELGKPVFRLSSRSNEC